MQSGAEGSFKKSRYDSGIDNLLVNGSDDDGYDDDVTTPFLPTSSSTLGPFSIEIEMKAMQHDKNGVLVYLKPDLLRVSPLEEISFG